MVRNTDKQLTIDEARELRHEAKALLERLTADCEASRLRLMEAGKRDPMKCVTGRSAFEDAISATRRMIAEMDELLADLDSELDAVEIETRTGHGVLVSAR